MTDEVERWLRFIAAKNYEERKIVAEGDELLMELNEWVKKYVRGDKAEELNKWDLEIATNKGYQDGLDEGRVLGLEEGQAMGHAAGVMEAKLELAQEMLTLNMPIEDISKITKLDVKDIEKIKNK